MTTTVQWLDAVKARRNLPSDYAAAQMLHVSRQRVSAWRNGKQTFEDEVCLRVAEILDVNPFEVMASVRIERIKEAERRSLWEHALEKISKGFRKLALPANACGTMVPQV